MPPIAPLFVEFVMEACKGKIKQTVRELHWIWLVYLLQLNIDNKMLILDITG
jgi:hypothetical protein